MIQTKNGKHSKPNQHNRPKHFTYSQGAKLLHKKQNRKNTKHNNDDKRSRDTGKARNLPKPFYGRSNGNRRSDNAVGKQRCSANSGRHYQPSSTSAYKRIQTKYAAFTIVISF